ncbi:beta-galactosidase [Rhynchospora pubera]|uniref:Beta-galactosidase n=1 Tax=Rhynchospora pubera TaxID=906938 RepID=A0AAV8CLK8_9POAL|nr:beta-galactosidase [Rhynchospora pubera]
MGNFFMKSHEPPPPPPPLVLVPPLFDFPPLAARTRMVMPAYDVLFAKLSLRCLFDDYFEPEKHFLTRIMLKPLEDPHKFKFLDLCKFHASPNENSGTDVEGNALFRWQKDLDDPHTFVDFLVSTSEPKCQLRSCAYYPRYRLGAFGVFPLLMQKRLWCNGSEIWFREFILWNFLHAFSCKVSGERPISGWIVARRGNLTAGVQYKPPLEQKQSVSDLMDMKNWSYAVGYGVGSTSPFVPLSTLPLSLLATHRYANGFTLFYIVAVDCVVLSAHSCTNKVNNPFESNQVVGITNYIDVGLELATRVDKASLDERTNKSMFQLAASWQAIKNFLIKGKLGAAKSSLSLAFKSWWKPSFTFSVTATNDHAAKSTSFGFGLRIEDLIQPSYQRADPNYVMLTPNKEHLAEGVLRELGKRTVFQSEVDSGNYDRLPRELKPIGKIF